MSSGGWFSPFAWLQVHWSFPGPLEASSPISTAFPPASTGGLPGGRRNLLGGLRTKQWGIQDSSFHQGGHPPAWGRGGDPRNSLPPSWIWEGGERALPLHPAPGKPVRSVMCPHRRPTSHTKAPLTEDDDKPHDEGQGSKDQAPVADSLIV